jgi:hypothetical protein
MRRILYGALVAAGLLQTLPAGAFDIVNHTPWFICVSGNKGHYATMIEPNTTDPGWKYNGTIELSISTWNRHSYSEDGDGTVSCNVRGAVVTVAPHRQLHITEALFEPGDVGDHRRAKQYIMWGLGLPAEFKWYIP